MGWGVDRAEFRFGRLLASVPLVVDRPDVFVAAPKLLGGSPGLLGVQAVAASTTETPHSACQRARNIWSPTALAGI
jgi:hypothetical protein